MSFRARPAPLGSVNELVRRTHVLIEVSFPHPPLAGSALTPTNLGLREATMFSKLSFEDHHDDPKIPF